jgi:hypothetical protein
MNNPNKPEINDDVFQYDDSPFKQCISGFGSNLKSYIGDIVEELREGYDGEEDIDQSVEQIKYHVDELVRWCRGFNAIAQHFKFVSTPHPIEEYHEDYGPVLWWNNPISEAPYSGSPLHDDWPGYHKYWTRLIVPEELTKENNV